MSNVRHIPPYENTNMLMRSKSIVWYTLKYNRHENNIVTNVETTETLQILGHNHVLFSSKIIAF